MTWTAGPTLGAAPALARAAPHADGGRAPGRPRRGCDPRLIHGYRAYWVEGVDLAEESQLRRIIEAAGRDADRLLAASRTEATREGLRAQTTGATSLGIFGAPACVIGWRCSGARSAGAGRALGGTPAPLADPSPPMHRYPSTSGSTTPALRLPGRRGSPLPGGRCGCAPSCSGAVPPSGPRTSRCSRCPRPRGLQLLDLHRRRQRPDSPLLPCALPDEHRPGPAADPPRGAGLS